MGVSEIDIVKFYFDIYGIYKIYLLLLDQHVNYNSFLSFICIFAFFPFEPLFQSIFYILTVLFLALLSICSINSHYMIQKDQIITFLRCLGVESSQLDSILEWYNKTVVYIIYLLYKIINSGKARSIELRIFQSYVERHNDLLYNVYKIHTAVISKIISKSTFTKIKNRMEYYEKKLHFSYPPEPCLSYLNRKFITHEPHPYYSDYRMDDSTRLTYLVITYEIKKRYGYAKRVERASKASSCNPSSVRNSTTEKYEEGQMRIKDSLKPTKSSISNHMLSPGFSTRSISAHKSQIYHQKRGTLLVNDKRTASRVFPAQSLVSPTHKDKTVTLEDLVSDQSKQEL